MNIVMLVRHHSFRDVRIFEKESKSLALMGHNVTIVAGRRAGYLFGINGEPVTNKELHRDKFEYEGIRFMCFDALYPYRGRTAQKDLNQRMIHNIKNHKFDYFQDPLYEKALSLKADIYIAHTPDVLYEAVQVKRSLAKRGKKAFVIFDAKELETRSTFLDVMMPEVDHLFTVSKKISDIYHARYPRMPITLILNSPFFDDHLPAKNFHSSPLVIAHEGELTEAKGNPQRIINLMKLMKKVRIPTEFRVIGGFYKGVNTLPKYRGVIQNLNAQSNIRNIGWLNFAELPKYYQHVHIGYIDFDLSSLNRNYALPNKFFSYLSNGVPVIVNAASEMSRIVKKYKCGIVINKRLATSRDYFLQLKRFHRNRNLLKRLSANARRAMKNVYCWQNMEKRLVNVMNSFQRKMGSINNGGKRMICMMTRNHSFQDARIVEKQAKSLARHGHSVNVIAGRRDGKLFGINGKPVLRSTFSKPNFDHDGIRFRTYEALYPSPTPEQKKQMEARMIANLQRGEQVYFPDGLYQRSLEVRADIYIAHEVDMLYEAVQVKRALAKQGYTAKVIWDAKELESWTPLLDIVMQDVDHIFTVSRSIQNIYKTWYPLKPITLIYNSPFYRKMADKNFYSYPFTVAHEGEITAEKGNPDKILALVNNCSNHIPFKFKVLGGLYFGAEDFPQFKHSVPQLKVHPQVDWVGWVSFDQLNDNYRDVHLGYIDFKQDDLNRNYALPNKFFSLLSNGVPVIVNNASDMAWIIRNYECGMVLDAAEATAEDFAKAILSLNNNRRLLEQWSRNARRIMKIEYSWDNMERRILQVIESIHKS